METMGEDGSTAQIVYSNGGLVDAIVLETLCDKVCNSFYNVDHPPG